MQTKLGRHFTQLQLNQIDRIRLSRRMLAYQKYQLSMRKYVKPHIDEIKKQPPHHRDEDGYLRFKKGPGNGNHAEQSMASLYLLVSMRPKLRRELKLKPRFKYLELLPKLN